MYTIIGFIWEVSYLKTYSASYEKEIYPTEVLFKTAYSFIKKAYIHFSIDGNKIIVTFTAKTDEELPDTIAMDFENALLAQTVRFHVYKETHIIREVLMARAMSSTMTMDSDPVELVEDNYLDDDIDDILKDWFVNEGKNI